MYVVRFRSPVVLKEIGLTTWLISMLINWLEVVSEILMEEEFKERQLMVELLEASLQLRGVPIFI